MIVFAIIAASILLAVLWLPPLLVAIVSKPPQAHGKLHGLGLVLPAQVAVATASAFLADYIGLRNPAGYILAISLAVGVGGAAALVYWRRFVNQMSRKSTPSASAE